MPAPKDRFEELARHMMEKLHVNERQWCGTLTAPEFITAALRQAYTDGMDEAARIAESMGHSNGRIRASHKHVAQAIRTASSVLREKK